jgi:citrate/tricarballylate utilization protein
VSHVSDLEVPGSARGMAGLTELLAEAERQLNICNACRYCEGYCAVFPALERRNLLTPGDMSHLANLCHDCRACFYACMYAPPHEFGINPPEILSELRSRSWAEDMPPGRFSRFTRGQARIRASVLAACAAVIGLIAGLAAVTEGIGALWRPHRGAASAYQVISYPVLLTVMAVPFVWSIAVFLRAGLRYWQRTRGPLRDLWNVRAWAGALAAAGQLRYLKGGGADCQYPDEQPSPRRRQLHGAVAYGFILCLVSTIAAGIEQDILGLAPPYPYLSVPVVTGTVGGVGLVIGSIGLIVLKRRSDPQATDARMTGRDYNLLVALAMLGATGLATLLLRDTAAFGIVLVLHLATVAVCFAVASLTKFSHVLYRLLALVQDSLETAQEQEAGRRAAEQRATERAAVS